MKKEIEEIKSIILQNCSQIGGDKGNMVLIFSRQHPKIFNALILIAYSFVTTKQKVLSLFKRV